MITKGQDELLASFVILPTAQDDPDIFGKCPTAQVELTIAALLC